MMTTRSTTSVVEFKHPFVVPGSARQFPPGRYEVLVEEELIEGLSFAAFRETGTYLMIHEKTHSTRPTEMRSISSAYLDMALKRDAILDTTVEGAFVSPSDKTIPEEEGSTLQDMQAQDLPSQETATVGNRIKQWIETVTSPLPR
ncbi:hypothetical protein [Paracoccus sp. SY]|uniref:hypothetical protein n=1 Tax=Paracoccus sp. SY TaxID=1330255 RepID=UPI001863A431|nr:hypothetical protein [Paracoccus sp. SY]